MTVDRQGWQRGPEVRSVTNQRAWASSVASTVAMPFITSSNALAPSTARSSFRRSFSQRKSASLKLRKTVTGCKGCQAGDGARCNCQASKKLVNTIDTSWWKTKYESIRTDMRTLYIHIESSYIYIYVCIIFRKIATKHYISNELFVFSVSTWSGLDVTTRTCTSSLNSLRFWAGSFDEMSQSLWRP